MKRLLNFLPFAFALAIIALPVSDFAQSNINTWTGALDIDWHKPCNWSRNTVPICTDSVILPSVTNKPTISATACATYVESKTGSQLTVLSPTLLHVGTCPCVPTINSAPAPGSPTPGVNGHTTVQVVWNWNSSAGALGYKYNTVNNYATATDNGSSTTYTQNGLTCNTLYTLFVWAYDACGSSAPLVLTQLTDPCVCSVSAPTSVSVDNNNFCSGTFPNITLTATGGSGTTLNWYTGSCGGTLIGSGSPLTIPAPGVTTTYYASWTMACGTSACASITETINNVPSFVNACGSYITPTSTSTTTLTYGVAKNNDTLTASFSGNPSTYSWSYTGTGFTEISFTNNGAGTAMLVGNFADTATGGLMIITATNACGTFSDEWFISVTGPVITDSRDLNTYPTVYIGKQQWLAANLNYPVGAAPVAIGAQANDAVPQRSCYGGTAAGCLKYGAEYTWGELVQYYNGSSNTVDPSPIAKVQGMCPVNWHVPSDAEWCTMENVVQPGACTGGNPDGAGTNLGWLLKYTPVSTAYWPNLDQICPTHPYYCCGCCVIGGPSGMGNTTGFNLVNYGGGFAAPANNAYLWSATPDGSGTNAYFRDYVEGAGEQISRIAISKANGYSTRCVHD